METQHLLISMVKKATPSMEYFEMLQQALLPEDLSPTGLNYLKQWEFSKNKR